MNLWIIGAGEIGGCYLQVLRHLGHNPRVVGRGEASARQFERAHGAEVFTGGFDAFAADAPDSADAVIIAVAADQLAAVALAVLRRGVRRILVEKPAGCSVRQIAEVEAAARRHGAQLYVAYNRRFLASVAKAREIIEADGGLTSLTFEFTEWPHRVLSAPQPPGALEAWFLLNSTHVIDLAFDIGGWPAQLSAFQARPLQWHEFGVFTGAGVTELGVPFSYHADWESSGRWRVDLCTRARRLVLMPLEKLFQIPARTLEMEAVVFDGGPDRAFKPGYLRQVEAFLGNRDDQPVRLPTIAEHLTHAETFAKMCPSAPMSRVAL